MSHLLCKNCKIQCLILYLKDYNIHNSNHYSNIDFVYNFLTPFQYTYHNTLQPLTSNYDLLHDSPGTNEFIHFQVTFSLQ